MKISEQVPLIAILKWRKLQTLCMLFVVFVLIFLLPSYYNINESDAIQGPQISTHKPPNPIPIFIVRCSTEEKSPQNEGQINMISQITTMLKTINYFTTRHLTIYLITNKLWVFEEVKKGVEDLEHGGNINVLMQEVWYPEDLADMVNQFKICATAKILVHEMFPTVDAGIVLDTDIVVMDDITNLWNNFQKFDSAQMAALAPVESHYSNVHNFPYYGPVGMGLNAGVILLNMTRMRRMVGGGFTEAIRVVWHKYADKLHLAEQDMLNIIFATSPRYLYELSCTWNYHTWQCRPDGTENPPIGRQKIGLNMCPEAAQTGISLLHGNCAAFSRSGDPLMRSVYSYWKGVELKGKNKTMVHAELRKVVEDIIVRPQYSKTCAAVPGVADIITNRLQQ